MKIAISIVAMIVIGVVLIGCAKRPTTRPAKKDVVDHDFVATIRKTKEQHVFEISIRKVNKNADKSIGSFPVIADLILKDSSGKIFSGENPDKHETAAYAKEVGEVFDMLREPGAESLTGRVRLLGERLPAGKYEVQPRIRIQEVGKDALRGPYDGGTVAVPADNTIQITVK